MILRCIKNFYMEDGKLAFVQGVDYPITEKCWDELEWLIYVNSETAEDHMMPMDELFFDYFQLVWEK